MKCKRRDTKAQYAVKIMNASFDASIEINSLKQCQGSEHIVCFIETMKDSHYNYIVFELLSGGELFKRIRDCNHFTESVARGYFRQLVAAVSYMHSKNIVHRDLKPENIMFVNNNGNDILKIVDFGFARKRSSESTVPCFTLDYAAPECLSKGKTTESGDLWSLGVILYTMCVGHTPFMPKTINKDDDELIYRSKLMDNIQKGSFDADSRYKHLSEPLKELIRGLLNVKEKTRFKLNDIQKNDWFVLEQSEVEDEIEEDIGEEEEEEELIKDDEEIGAEEEQHHQKLSKGDVEDVDDKYNMEDTNETKNGILNSNIASGDEEEEEVTEVISDEEPEMDVDEAKGTSFERTDSVATEVFDPQEQDINDFDMSAKTEENNEEETKMENIDYLNDSRSKSSGIAGMSDPNDRSSNSIEEECEMDNLIVSVDKVIKNEIYHNVDEEMEEQSEQPEEIISPNNLEDHVLVGNLSEMSVSNVETMHVKSFSDDEQKTFNDQEVVQLQQHPNIIKSVEVSPQRNEESNLVESREIPEGYVEVRESQLENGYQLKDYPIVDCLPPKGVAPLAIVDKYLLGFHKTEVECFYFFRGFDIYGKTPFDAFTFQDFPRKLIRKYKLRKRQLPRKNQNLREQARIAKKLKASMRPEPVRRSTRRCTVTVKFEIEVKPRRGLKRRRNEIDLDAKALTVISDVPIKSEPKVIEKPIAKARLSQAKAIRKPRQPRQPRQPAKKKSIHKKEVEQPVLMIIKKEPKEPKARNSVIMVKSTVSPKNSRFHRQCKLVPGNVKKEPVTPSSKVKKTISIKSRNTPPDNSLFEFQRISRGSVKKLGLDIYDFYEPLKKKQKTDQ